MNEPGQRYRLESRIATGGMGEVWRATDTVLDREVAVKLLKPEYADDPTFRSRFEAEARSAAALHHPRVASVFDFGDLPATDGSGQPRPFLVMELVPGRPLSAVLQGQGPMPPETAADLVAQAADAIAAAHAMGIVHRDVKPANLLITPDGNVKITDFGIARAADTVSLTRTGEVVGTPHYISPEQAEGQPATEASDIYSLGVVLFECLAGHRPFVGDTPVLTALAHLREPVPALPDSVPARLRDIVSTSLAKDPAARFAGAAEFARALRGDAPPPLQVAGAAAAPAPTQALTEQTAVLGAAAGSRTRRRRAAAWWPWAAAAVGVLVVVLAVSSLTGDGEPDTTVTDEPSPSAGPAEGPPAPQDDRIRVRADRFVGTDKDDAKSRLQALGLEVEEEKVPATSPDQQKDTVASVTPHGLVQPDSVITLGVLEEYKPPEDGDDDPDDDADERPAQSDAQSKAGAKDKDGKGGDKGKAKGKKQR